MNKQAIYYEKTQNTYLTEPAARTQQNSVRQCNFFKWQKT